MSGTRGLHEAEERPPARADAVHRLQLRDHHVPAEVGRLVGGALRHTRTEQRLMRVRVRVRARARVRVRMRVRVKVRVRVRVRLRVRARLRARVRVAEQRLGGVEGRLPAVAHQRVELRLQRRGAPG